MTLGGMGRSAALALLVFAMSGCGGEETLNETGVMLVQLPGGQKIKAEVMTNPTDMMRGMMFRDSLAPDRGMLFVHNGEQKAPYWMYQVKIPLDIIWIDKGRHVVEISRNTPPCKTQAHDCPNYGGHVPAAYVLELAGGSCDKYGIKEGDTISF